MRRPIALLTAALLTGCGLTDGPNRTGSAWLDSLDLGPQGLESASFGLRSLEVDTILEPGVPSLNGVGTLVLGGTDALASTTSLWFDPSDSARWARGAKSERGNWKLELDLDTRCSRPDGIDVLMWSGIRDTLAFLSGIPMGTPERTVAARCVDDTVAGVGRVSVALLDSHRVEFHSSMDFGLRLVAPDFASRQIVAARLVDGVDDTLRTGILEGRAAWGMSWSDRGVGSLASSLGWGKRLRLRLDGASLREALAAHLGLPETQADSFDNTVSLFSARVGADIDVRTPGTARRFRLASWVVRHTDVTWGPVGASTAWSSSRPEDGASMEGTLVVREAGAGTVRVALLSGSDSVPFLTRDGQIQYSFVLRKDREVEAPMHLDPGWTKFRFLWQGGKVRFERQVLAAPVAADDQIEAVDDGSYVFRDEAVAVPGLGRIRFEARTAFSRILNRTAQEVWTDLYPVAVQTDSVVNDDSRIDLGSEPLDSVTFLFRRRITGAVQ